jgi:hypothetical protein
MQRIPEAIVPVLEFFGQKPCPRQDFPKQAADYRMAASRKGADTGLTWKCSNTQATETIAGPFRAELQAVLGNPNLYGMLATVHPFRKARRRLSAAEQAHQKYCCNFSHNKDRTGIFLSRPQSKPRTDSVSAPSP